VRDSKHPCHLDPRKLALKYGTVRSLHWPQQKPLRLNSCLIKHPNATVVALASFRNTRPGQAAITRSN
jgi:hypothetical protein